MEGVERLKVTIEIQPEEAAALLREITKTPQAQSIQLNWGVVKEGVDTEGVKEELANGHAHDLICEELDKVYRKFAVRS